MTQDRARRAHSGGLVVAWASRDLRALGAGTHEARFDDLPHLAPGLYFVTLRASGDARSSRILHVVVLR